MRSMTGYGSGQAEADGRELTLELKAVNHRYLDISIRLPKQLAFLEDDIRRLIQHSDIARGHVDALITYTNTRCDAQTVIIDMELLTACRDAAASAAKELSNLKEPTLAELITLSGALSVTRREDDAQAVKALAAEAFSKALSQLTGMRHSEGEALRADLLGNLDKLEALVGLIARRAPEVPEAFRERLEARLLEWGVQGTDPQRIAQEVALIADRCAIDEEISRILSHIAQFRACAASGGEAGRRLDFLTQEMNREINTIGSKAGDAEIAHNVVEAKCAIEKLREQAQNVV